MAHQDFRWDPRWDLIPRSQVSGVDFLVLHATPMITPAILGSLSRSIFISATSPILDQWTDSNPLKPCNSPLDTRSSQKKTTQVGVFHFFLGKMTCFPGTLFHCPWKQRASPLDPTPWTPNVRLPRTQSRAPNGSAAARRGSRRKRIG